MKDEDKDKTVLEYIVRHCDRISRALISLELRVYSV